jgi:transcription elongation factor Elf1
VVNNEVNAEHGFECHKCAIPLVSDKVSVTYLGSTFTVDLLKCKNCGAVLITEDLALGKMLEVEKTLEDK